MDQNEEANHRSRVLQEALYVTRITRGSIPSSVYGLKPLCQGQMLDSSKYQPIMVTKNAPDFDQWVFGLRWKVFYVSLKKAEKLDT